MKIFELTSDPDRYDPLSAKCAETRRWLGKAFYGAPLSASWPVPQFRYFSEVEPPNLPRGDYPGYLTIPVFSPRAVEVLGALLRPNGELLQVQCHEDTYYMFNILTLIDCLDQDRSELERFDDGGVMAVDRYAFKEDLLRDATIFKIPEFPRGRNYVTDRFVDRVEQAGLKGFQFKLLYESPAE